MMKTYNLKSKIWLYLVFFSIAILAFLWFFQVIFINKYYEWTKIRNIREIANTLTQNTTIDGLNQTLDQISYLENIAIEITTNEAVNVYASRGNYFSTDQLKYDFIHSNLSTQTYRFKSQFFNDQTLTQAVKLSDNLYAFITTSLEPIDSTVKILKEQLIIVSIIVLSLSFVIAFFISRHLSQPIVKISEAASLIAKGKIHTTFKSDSDIKELVLLADALNEMKEELSKTEELQKDLMANVSHDLKTPLTMIKAYAELVRDINYSQEEKRNDNLNIIIEETDRLALLVNDILTLSKLQSSIDDLTLEEFDLIELINHILKRFDIFTKKDKYQLIFQHEHLDKIPIKADKKKLEQVIYNLLINAINYTGDDKIVTIQITLENEMYKIQIIDTGKGINKSEIDHIWDKYYKDKKNHQRNVYGTGLGLSIVKNILVLHNYDYGVTSKKKKGSIFYFMIPKQK